LPVAARVPGVLAALCALVLALGATPAHADIGEAGPSFLGASAPTGQKPQSKSWFHDGIWWSVLFDRATDQYEIYKRDGGRLVSTGTVVDRRNKLWNDVLWDGSRLHVVSAAQSQVTGSAVRYYRFTYDSTAQRYDLEVGQVTLTSWGVEAAVVDRDSAGHVWIVYTHGQAVWTTHTVTGPTDWSTPIVLPVVGADTLTSDDIASVVAFNGHIGVMWSNQNDGAFHWATHVDGDPQDAWTGSIAAQGAGLSDDHLNLKALDDDPAGQVFAAVKTSLDRSTDPLQLLLVLDDAGAWHRYTTFQVRDGGPTRAQVAIDTGRRELYVFAAEGPCCTGGAIFMKKTSLDAIAFESGKGAPVLESATDTHINNASTTKQTVDAASGLLVLAGDDTTDRYWQTLIPLDGSDIVPPETTITGSPPNTTSATSAQFDFSSSEPGSTFACSLDAAAPVPCTSPASYDNLAAGEHTFTVHATDAAGNTDPTPASRTWTVSTSAALFLDGFESGDLAQWSTVATGADGAAAVQSAVTAFGAFAARLSATSAAGSFAYARKTLSPAPSSLTVTATVRVDGEGAPGGNVPLLRLYDPAGTRLLTVYRPNGSTKLYVHALGGAYTATRGRLPTATFKRLAVDVVTAGTGAGTLVMRVDGTQVYATSTASLGTAGVATLQIGNDTRRQPFVVYVDDVEAR